MTKTPLHLLLVEDNPYDAELIEHELQKKGFDLTSTRVQTREQFLEHLDPSLDIVLSDYALPQFSGEEALSLLKERYPEIPLIIITGVLGDEKAAGLVKQGAADYLLKDRLARLDEAIDSAVQRRTQNRKAKEQDAHIQEEEEKFHLIFENSMDAQFLTIPDGTILAANQAACDMFGWTEAEIIQGGRNLIVDISDPRLETALEERARNGRVTGELTFIRKDGARFPGELKSTIYTDYHGQPRTSMIIRDISDRKRNDKVTYLKNRVHEIANKSTSLDEMLSYLIEEFRDFSGCEAVGIRLLDKEGNIPYHSHIGFSQEFIESESPLNINKDECLCVYAIKNTVPHDLSFITSHGSFRTNELTRLLTDVPKENMITTRNICHQMGYESVAIIPIRTPTTIIGLVQFNDPRKNMVPLEMVQIIEEISLPLEETIRRMQTEDALRKSEEEYRTVLQTMVQGVVYQDAKGAIISANPAAEKILGLSLDQMKGRTSIDPRWKAIHEDGSTFPGEEHPAMLALKTGKCYHGYVMGIFNPSESTQHWILIDATPVYSEHESEILKVYTIFTDITELKKVEEELRHLNEDLEEQVAERTQELKTSLQEKEMLLKEIHHRVKNNMQVISSLLYLQAQTAQDEQTRIIFSESQNRIRTISLVHEQLYQSQNLSRIDYGEYLKRMFGPLFESYRVDSRQVRMIIDVMMVMITIDKAVPCSLIVNELISNSLKYGFPNGRKGEIRIGFTLNPENETYVLDYQDNGVGFPSDFHMDQGKTLGMSLINGLTGQLNGKIEQLGGDGVHFIISFPSIDFRRR